MMRKGRMSEIRFKFVPLQGREHVVCSWNELCQECGTIHNVGAEMTVTSFKACFRSALDLSEELPE